MNHPVRAAALVLSAEIVAVVLVTSVGARDMPRGRSAPPARSGCEGFGPDFHKVEGSNTCVRISGSAEVEAIVRTGSGAGSSFFPGSPKR